MARVTVEARDDGYLYQGVKNGSGEKWFDSVCVCVCVIILVMCLRICW